VNLAKDPIPHLLKKIAIPASVGMFFNTMYYIVDNFYAGMLSSTALAGISLAAPIYFMGIAVSIGVGQGTNALVGNARGEDRHDLAEQIAGRAISFAWLSAILIGLTVLFFAADLFRIMGAEGDYTQYALNYLSIILPALLLSAHAMTANGILNSLGDTTSFRNGLIVAFFANIALDPLLMFGFGWGVYGLAAIYLTLKVRQSRLGQSLTRANLLPNWSQYKALFNQSLPASTNMFFIALGSIIVTSAVAQFGENAVAGLGIALRIEQLILLPTVGLNIAVLSLVSVNFGARQFDRMEKVAVDSIRIGTIMMIFGGILVFAFARPLISLFTDDANVIDIGVGYLRVEALILPAYVLSFVSGAVLQGMKRAAIPMYFNLVRQLLLPSLFIAFSLIILETSIFGIWWSISIATWLTVGLQFVHMRGLVKQQVKI
jgi:putative MATE family efflux protein